MGIYIDESNVEMWEEIVSNSNGLFEMEDIYWFEHWQPELLDYIERWDINPYTRHIEKFGTWDAWCDYCAYYDLDVDEPQDAILIDDAGLSGVFYFTLY